VPGADWSFVWAAYYGVFDHLTEPDPDRIPAQQLTYRPICQVAVSCRRIESWS
jgi:hypothetical protein